MTRPSILPRALLSLLVLGSFLLLTACVASAGREPARETASALPAGPTGTLEGTVTDADGSAVGGAHITVHHPGYGRKWTARADMEGNFLLLDLPVGENYKVTVSTPPFWTTTLRQISVAAGKTTRLAVVRRLGHRGGPLSATEGGTS